MRYDVFGMCNALFDIQGRSGRNPSGSGLTKGTMSLIGSDEQKQIVPHIYTHTSTQRRAAAAQTR